MTARMIWSVGLPTDHTPAQWRDACETAYSLLREQRETPHDDITPMEHWGNGEHRAYLHTNSGRNAYVSIVVLKETA